MYTSHINPAEILAAAPDYFAIQMGVVPSAPHPLADHIDLKAVAIALGEKARPRCDDEHDQAVMVRGAGTESFRTLIAESTQARAIVSFAAAAAEHLAFVSTTPVKGLKVETIPGIDGNFDLHLQGELSELQRSDAVTLANGIPLELQTFGRVVILSRVQMINDDFGSLGQVFSAIGSSAAQKEAWLLAQALGSNPSMPDGGLLFSESNTVATALTGPALGLAMAALRTQKSAEGNVLNLRARHLVVSPELEFAALQLVREGGLDGIAVCALAGLPVGRWLLFPDPKIHQVITLPRLNGSPTPLRVIVKNHFASSGVGIAIFADLGPAFLCRAGIVRGGADLA